MQKFKRPTGEVIFILDENDNELAPANSITFKRKEWDYLARLIKDQESLVDKTTFLNGCVESKRILPSWDIFKSFPEETIAATEEIFKPQKKEETAINAIANETIAMLRAARLQPNPAQETKPLERLPDENYPWEQLSLAQCPPNREAWIAAQSTIQELTPQEINRRRKEREKKENQERWAKGPRRKK